MEIRTLALNVDFCVDLLRWCCDKYVHIYDEFDFLQDKIMSFHTEGQISSNDDINAQHE